MSEIKRRYFLIVRSGSGGLESQDFALMLFRMYGKFAKKQKEECEIVSINYGSSEGLKEGTLQIQSNTNWVDGEGGVHRLQRISPFGKGERQTSFCSVEVLNGEEIIVGVLKESDLKEEFFRSSGPGGQNRNKVETSVKLLHKPTGLKVTINSGRSQWQNRQLAREILAGRIKNQFEEDTNRIVEGMGSQWGKQIRTYSLSPKKFIVNHISDKRSNKVIEVLNGELDLII